MGYRFGLKGAFLGKFSARYIISRIYSLESTLRFFLLAAAVFCDECFEAVVEKDLWELVP